MHKAKWKSELIDGQIGTWIFPIKNRAILDLSYSLLKGYSRLFFVYSIHPLTKGIITLCKSMQQAEGGVPEPIRYIFLISINSRYD